MNILYLMSSANIFGGTPKKTLELIRQGNFHSSIYFWSDQYAEYQKEYQEAGASVYTGNYGRNVFKHIRRLLHIIDQENIRLVQTQFSMGEFLGYWIKIFRPKVKLVIAFVGMIDISGSKKIITRIVFRKADAFIFVSNYVKKEKTKQFPRLKNRLRQVIYNGTTLREDTGEDTITMKSVSILDVAGLVDWKNIAILIEALHVLIHHKGHKNIYLYVAGDGPEKERLLQLISGYHLEEHAFLLGYQKNIGRLLNNCDIFVHPSYAEGFGIAVAEAMMAQKPVIVSNAGALPELIENEFSGLIVAPHDAGQWADAILRIINDRDFAEKLSSNAGREAEKRFSAERYVMDYQELYKKLTGI